MKRGHVSSSAKTNTNSIILPHNYHMLLSKQIYTTNTRKQNKSSLIISAKLLHKFLCQAVNRTRITVFSITHLELSLNSFRFCLLFFRPNEIKTNTKTEINRKTKATTTKNRQEEKPGTPATGVGIGIGTAMTINAYFLFVYFSSIISSSRVGLEKKESFER